MCETQANVETTQRQTEAMQHEEIEVIGQEEQAIDKGTNDNASSCANCDALKDENRQLRNQIKSLQRKLQDKRKILRKTQGQGEYMFVFRLKYFLLCQA